MKDLKSFINNVREDVTPEDANREMLPDDERYCVIYTGGSIGEQDSMKFRYGAEHCRIVRDNLTADEAKGIAKIYRSTLTPGEKQYYRMNYRAVPAIKVKSV